MTLFVLQNNHMERLVYPVLDYCRERGYQWLDRSMTSETDFYEFPYEEFKAHNTPKIIYGSVGWCKRASNCEFTAPWVWEGDVYFDASHWSKKLGRNFLNGDGDVAIAKYVPQFLLTHGPMHVRPCNEDKAFVGAVYDADSWNALCSEREILNGLTVWISSPKQIKAEFRSWCINGKIVEISQYRRDNVAARERVRDSNLFAVAESLAEQLDAFTWYPYVLDFAETNDGFKLIETNPIHASGWYAADVSNVLDEWVKLVNN